MILGHLVFGRGGNALSFEGGGEQLVSAGPSDEGLHQGDGIVVVDGARQKSGRKLGGFLTVAFQNSENGIEELFGLTLIGQFEEWLLTLVTRKPGEGNGGCPSGRGMGFGVQKNG